MASTLRINVHQSTGTIILDRPAKRNALNRALLTDLLQALDDLHQERRVRAVIITGAGSAFCAGLDLTEMLAATTAPDAFDQWHRDVVVYRELMEKMLQFPKPLIAAVNGPAVAGGAGVVLACDIVVASEEASFGFPEPRRGIVAGLVAPLLKFRIGGGHAARLLLTATLIESDEAYRIGLFHQVVPPDVLWPHAVRIANQCAEAAPEALLLTKRMLNETIGEELAMQLTAGAAVSATSRTTEAAQEGLQAFQDKRPPNWQ